jgi:peptidoglycan/LPS O-acetylase OafA/YrhL
MAFGDNSARRTPHMAQTSTIPALTSLRFFAAAAILLLHYRDLLGPLPAVVRTLIIGGQFGVTFFFLLSGFILTYTYETWFAGNVSGSGYWRFQTFRLARIYPTYLLGLLLDTPIQIVARDIGSETPVYWAAWVVNLFGLQAWTPGAPFTLVWNTPSWSISTEFFFYACFPFICSYLFSNVRTAASVTGMFVSVILASTAVYAVVLYQIYVVHELRWDVSYGIQHYLPLLRVPEFITGCLVGRLFMLGQDADTSLVRFFSSAARRNLVVIVCLALIFIRILMPAYTGPFRLLWLLDNASKFSFFMLPFAGIIYAIASGRTLLTGLLTLPLLVLLGEASYALYITHWVGQSILNAGLLGSAKTPWMSGVFMLLSIVASVIIYRYFETPCRKWLRSKT